MFLIISVWLPTVPGITSSYNNAESDRKTNYLFLVTLTAKKSFSSFVPSRILTLTLHWPKQDTWIFLSQREWNYNPLTLIKIDTLWWSLGLGLGLGLMLQLVLELGLWIDFLTALLKCNSHTIKFMHLISKTQCLSVCSQSCATIKPQSVLKHFCHPQRESYTF